ncbi:MAG: hypothetical protein K0R71_194 [Bacillales bacterium]|jgi:hypothetical protein|nr:hypothetical protein [Bacillales bacterium]
MNLYQSFVNQRLRTLTPNEIVELARNNGISINQNEAVLISQKLQSSHVNVFNDTERFALLKEVAQITSPHIANEVEKLFQYFVSK